MEKQSESPSESTGAQLADQAQKELTIPEQKERQKLKVQAIRGNGKRYRPSALSRRSMQMAENDKRSPLLGVEVMGGFPNSNQQSGLKNPGKNNSPDEIIKSQINNYF